MMDGDSAGGPTPLDDSDPVVIAAGDRLIVDQMADLTCAMTKVADGLQRTTPTLETVDRRSRLQSWTIGALLLATLGVGAVGWTAKGIGDQIKSCIDPAGDCYRESRSRTGEVEGRIVSDQAARSERNLRAVCAVFVEHRLPSPVECTSTTTTTRTPNR